MTTITPRDTTASVADAPAELTDGYHLVVDALKVHGVRTVYGLVGIPITDVARAAQSSGMRYIGFRHESDAGHAAAAGFLTKGRYLSDGVGTELPHWARGAGERHHELPSDGSDFGVADAEHVGLHAGGDERGLGIQKLRHARLPGSGR